MFYTVLLLTKQGGGFRVVGGGFRVVGLGECMVTTWLQLKGLDERILQYS